MRPLQGCCEDITYTGHWIVFPRAKRYARSIVMFLGWLGRELGLNLDLGSLGPTSAAGPADAVGRVGASADT